MKITFTGDLYDGTLQDPHTGAVYPFRRGEVVEVPDELAKQAIASGIWQIASENVTTATISSASKRGGKERD